MRASVWQNGAAVPAERQAIGRRRVHPQLDGLVWCYNLDTGPGIRADGPHRSSGATDLLFATLELNIAFASQSIGSVLPLSSVGLS